MTKNSKIMCTSFSIPLDGADIWLIIGKKTPIMTKKYFVFLRHHHTRLAP
jgi:hypothetical protein